MSTIEPGEWYQVNTSLSPLPPSVTYSFSPAKTIWGLPVNTVSYIFLGIAGIAPIVFIISVIIGMKCYSVRKRQQFRRHQARYRTSQELWELERRQYMQQNLSNQRQQYLPPRPSDNKTMGSDSMSSVISSAVSLPQRQNNQLMNGSSTSLGTHTSSNNIYSHKKEFSHLQLKPSECNPNVYFTETSLLDFSSASQPRPHHLSTSAMSPGQFSTDTALTDMDDMSSPQTPDSTGTNLSSRTGTNLSSSTSTNFSSSTGTNLSSGLGTNLSSRKRLTSATDSLQQEEARVLACFDKIYEDIETSSSSQSDNKSQGGPSGSTHDPLSAFANDGHSSAGAQLSRTSIILEESDRESPVAESLTSQGTPVISHSVEVTVHVNRTPKEQALVKPWPRQDQTFVNDAFSLDDT